MFGHKEKPINIKEARYEDLPERPIDPAKEALKKQMHAPIDRYVDKLDIKPIDTVAIYNATLDKEAPLKRLLYRHIVVPVWSIPVTAIVLYLLIKGI